VTVNVRRADGCEQLITARAVIDASGAWQTPNPLGGDGLPAVGERAATDRVAYRIPSIEDPQARARYAGKHVVVAGSGHSALTVLVALSGLAKEDPATRISRILRGGAVGNTFGGGGAGQLPARGALGLRAKAAVDAGVVTGFRTEAITRDSSGRLVLSSPEGRRVEAVDEPCRAEREQQVAG
jgi:hypothetical protein